MGKFFRNKYIISLILATLIIFLTMSIFDTDRPNVSFVENIAGVVITPVQKLLSTVGYWFGNINNYFADVDMLKTENATLRSGIEALKKDIRDLDGLRSENDRLRKMLNLKENAQEFDIESAEIVSKDPGNWYNTFTIDKGTSNGLAKKQPVITSDKALVGYIYDIGTNWAKITSVIDPDSSIGSIIVRSRDIGIIEGDITLRKDGLCKLTYISKNTNVITGDYIETSGMGGVYPKGILIGQILEIRPETHSISQYAIVEPAVDFEKITEVFVIKNPPESY